MVCTKSIVLNDDLNYIVLVLVKCTTIAIEFKFDICRLFRFKKKGNKERMFKLSIPDDFSQNPEKNRKKIRGEEYDLNKITYWMRFLSLFTFKIEGMISKCNLYVCSLLIISFGLTLFQGCFNFNLPPFSSGFYLSYPSNYRFVCHYIEKFFFFWRCIELNTFEFQKKKKRLTLSKIQTIEDNNTM